MTNIPISPLQAWITKKIGSEEDSLSRAAIQAYQLKKINQTLRLAAENSIFYRKKLSGYDLCINSFEALSNLPFTTAEELSQFSLQMICVSQSQIERVVSLDTSGTSGIPKRCYFTKEDQNLTVDFFGVGMSCLVNPADRVLILLPGETPGSVGDLLAIGLLKQGIFAMKYGAVQDVAEVLSLITQQQITCLVGVPSHVLALNRWAIALNLPQPRSLRSVLLSTDHVPTPVIQAIETAWGCRVYNHYGMTEMGLGGGVDCQAHIGYHLREADLYFEIIDPYTGKPVPDGKFGEVVFTTLTRKGMPLVRYRTGDISRFLLKPCPCGTSLKTMEWIKRRINSSFEIVSGELYLADFDEVLFELDPVLDFTVRIDRKCQLPTLKFEVFCAYLGLTETVIRERLEKIAFLQQALRENALRVNIKITLGLPEHFGSLAKRKME